MYDFLFGFLMFWKETVPVQNILGTNLIVVDRRVLGNTGQCFANKFQPVNDVPIPKLLKLWVQLSPLIAPVGICGVLGGWVGVRGPH